MLKATRILPTSLIMKCNYEACGVQQEIKNSSRHFNKKKREGRKSTNVLLITRTKTNKNFN